MHPRRRFLGLALALPLVTAACSASAGPPSGSASSPGVSVARPSDGVSLRQLGYLNGPVDQVFLPAAVQVTRRVDQVNVTTAFGPAADGPSLFAYLRRTLPSAGWTVDADAGGSLLFHSSSYDGAYTQSPDLWALTLRRNPG